jgi:hypothetical protein
MARSSSRSSGIWMSLNTTNTLLLPCCAFVHARVQATDIAVNCSCKGAISLARALINTIVP